MLIGGTSQWKWKLCKCGVMWWVSPISIIQYTFGLPSREVEHKVYIRKMNNISKSGSTWRRLVMMKNIVTLILNSSNGVLIILGRVIKKVKQFRYLLRGLGFCNDSPMDSHVLWNKCPYLISMITVCADMLRAFTMTCRITMTIKRKNN